MTDQLGFIIDGLTVPQLARKIVEAKIHEMIIEEINKLCPQVDPAQLQLIPVNGRVCIQCAGVGNHHPACPDN